MKWLFGLLLPVVLLIGCSSQSGQKEPAEEVSGEMNEQQVELAVNPVQTDQQIGSRSAGLRRLPLFFRAVIHFKNGHKRFLRHFYRADLLHPAFSFFLFFKKLPFPRDVSSVTFCKDVFPHGLNG